MENFIKPKSKTNWLYIIIIILVVVFASGAVLIYQQEELKKLEKGLEENQVAHTVCLKDDEIANYEIKKKEEGGGMARISIKDRNTNRAIFEFEIDNITLDHRHPYEIHKCGVYLVREFNIDYKRGKPLPNFKMEVWRYYYDGSGEKLAEENDFRVDPTEHYVALVRSYLGQPDYALVIKDLKTKEDVFALAYNDLINKYSAPEGGLDLGGWQDGGKSFLGIIHVAAKSLACFSIEKDTWETKVFPIPEEAMTVDSISENGEYIAYDNGPGRIGIYEHALQIYDEWRKQGKQQSLIVYNLFTKERIVLETIDDPSWSFNAKWISDTELEYEMPNGEKKIYKIND